MGVENRTFVVCDAKGCEEEDCIDETGECGLPISEMLSDGWTVVDGETFCPKHSADNKDSTDG